MAVSMRFTFLMMMPVIMVMMVAVPVIMVLIMMMAMIVGIVMPVLMMVDALVRAAAARVFAEQQRLDRDRHGE